MVRCLSWNWSRRLTNQHHQPSWEAKISWKGEMLIFLEQPGTGFFSQDDNVDNWLIHLKVTRDCEEVGRSSWISFNVEIHQQCWGNSYCRCEAADRRWHHQFFSWRRRKERQRHGGWGQPEDWAQKRILPLATWSFRILSRHFWYLALTRRK